MASYSRPDSPGARTHNVYMPRTVPIGIFSRARIAAMMATVLPHDWRVSSPYPVANANAADRTVPTAMKGRSASIHEDGSGDPEPPNGQPPSPKACVATAFRKNIPSRPAMIRYAPNTHQSTPRACKLRATRSLGTMAELTTGGYPGTKPRPAWACREITGAPHREQKRTSGPISPSQFWQCTEHLPPWFSGRATRVQLKYAAPKLRVPRAHYDIRR